MLVARLIRHTIRGNTRNQEACLRDDDMTKALILGLRSDIGCADVLTELFTDNAAVIRCVRSMIRV